MTNPTSTDRDVGLWRYRGTQRLVAECFCYQRSPLYFSANRLKVQVVFLTMDQKRIARRVI